MQQNSQYHYIWLTLFCLLRFVMLTVSLKKNFAISILCHQLLFTNDATNSRHFYLYDSKCIPRFDLRDFVEQKLLLTSLTRPSQVQSSMFSRIKQHLACELMKIMKLFIAAAEIVFSTANGCIVIDVVAKAVSKYSRVKIHTRRDQLLFPQVWRDCSDLSSYFRRISFGKRNENALAIALAQLQIRFVHRAEAIPHQFSIFSTHQVGHRLLSQLNIQRKKMNVKSARIKGRRVIIELKYN